jgi:Carboxypeptidase regulatory-like domain/TonB-dependent Receptor Plug Domain
VRNRKLLVSFVVVLTMCAVSIPSVMAQTGSTAALTGRVSDPTGAVLPGVTVTVTATATNQSRNTVTAEDGVYRVPLLDPGSYKVKFTLPGFKTAEVMEVTLAVTETSVLNQTLAVGAASEEVTVEANVEAIQTATSTLGTTVTGNAIGNLPLVSRNFTAVLGMSAGVAVAANNGTAFGKGTENMSVNGANPEKNNFQMDGVSINNAAGNNEANDAGLYTGIAVPNPDAIQEFKIQTSTYDASYGRNPGANVNVVTRGGSNEFHGSLFEFFRNEALNANDFFYNRDRRPGSPDKQILRQNQFGGSIGGPVVKDKVFFFGSYQGTRQFNGVAGQGTTSAVLYPIPDNREATDFAARLGAATCAFQTRAGSIPIACDGSNINSAAIALLRVKLPNGSYYIPGSGTSGTRQTLFSIPAKYRENQFIANGDWIMSSAHSLQVRLMKAKNPYEYQLSGQLPGRFATDKRSNESGLLRLTSILSPALVNQARVSVQRIIERGSETLPYTPQQVGMKPLIDINCCNGTTAGSYTQPTALGIAGAFNIGGALFPSDAPTTQIQLSDQLSWTKGKHTLRAGYEYEFVRWPLTFGGLGRGNVTVNSFPDFLIGRAGCAPTDTTCSPTNPGNTTGSPLSSFTLCLFCVRSSYLGIVHNYALRNQYAFFQDDWTVNSRLTLNIGVRWERFGQLGDKYGNLTNFWASDLRSVPIPPSFQDFSDPRGFIGYVVPNNYDDRPIPQGHGPIPNGVRQFDGRFASENRIPLSNFAPRIGFAWQPMGSGRFVVRGGAGIFYDRVGINRMVHAVQEGRPYADTLTLQHDVASLQSLFQDRPLAILPRWYDFNRLTGSNFDSPYYDHIQTPLVRQYNLGIQYEVARSYVVEIAYVGSSGINIGDYSHNVNTAQLASSSNPINGIITTNTVQNASARVPYLGFTPIGLQKNDFNGVYNYNSLQTTFRKQFSRGFGFQAAYTWSKNLTNVSWNSANINNPNDMDQQYGQAPYSRPQRFVIGYQYELPFKADGVVGKFVGGWMASGNVLVQSGNPLTLFDGRGGSIYTGGTPTNSDKGASRAQLCPGKTYADIATTGSVKDRLGSASNSTVKRFFDSSAFCAPPTIGNGFDWGSTGIGVLRGPGQANTDFSITKTTPIGERQTLQFRSEFFNLFNHPQFALPINSGTFNAALRADNPTFGLITATSVSPRIIQFAVRVQF